MPDKYHAALLQNGIKPQEKTFAEIQSAYTRYKAAERIQDSVMGRLPRKPRFNNVPSRGGKSQSTSAPTYLDRGVMRDSRREPSDRQPRLNDKPFFDQKCGRMGRLATSVESTRSY